MFSSDELAVERLMGQVVEARVKLVRQSLRTLAQWHRSRVRAADPAALPEERVDAELARLEAEVWLDVMSAGWFGRRIGAGRSP